MRLSFVCVAGAVALLISGCSTPDIGGSQNIQVVDGVTLPPPSALDASLDSRAYVLGPGDKISVEVFGLPDLNRVVQVDSAGRISLPLAGEFIVLGMTPTMLANEVGERLGPNVRDPRVTVNLAEAVSQAITIDGAVEEPGVYPVIGEVTLIRAIARAKGTTEFARQNHVVVFRTVGGQKMAALYDLRAIRRGVYDDPEVYANDVVVVGEAHARRLFETVLQSAAILTTPIVALIQRR